MLSSLMCAIFLLSSWAGFDFIDNYTVSYTTNTTGQAVVTLSWDLNETADSLIICRGDQVYKVLPLGTETSIQIIEDNHGEFQYSIGWKKYGVMLQWETLILNLGKLSWEPPTQSIPSDKVDGYYVYVELESGTLDHNSPKYEVVGMDLPKTILPLILLRAIGLIEPNLEYKYAVASYKDFNTERSVSQLTDSVSTIYLDVTIPWAPPKAPTNINAGF